ncbi:MAG: BspA family leucine-rich repeat surface protein [Clostridia bacterium]|nr:BspA family leucine-rich repeat surface protein [Clostridia bacterium]
MDTNSHFLSLTSHSSGITLIALIITIVIMLILAGITINLTLGENGIFQKAKLAKGQYETASVQEKLELELASMQMGRQTDLTVAEYVNELEDKGIVLQENIILRETETALKINGEIFVVYLEDADGQVKVYHEEGNVMKAANLSRITNNWLGTGLSNNTIKTIQFVGNIPQEIKNVNLEEENYVEYEGVQTFVADVSAEGEDNGTVMCWWTDAGTVTVGEENITVYDVTIGANGGVTAPRNSVFLFDQMGNLTIVNAENYFYTRNTTNMGCMFYDCKKLENLNLNKTFDTSKVTNMNQMFVANFMLNELDLSKCNFDTSNVKWMSRMFYSCSGLSNLILGSDFNTRNVETMQSMFYGCKVLTNLNLEDKFDTSKVTNMSFMFYDCEALSSLDLGENFNTKSLVNASGMFMFCKNIEILNLGDKFDTNNITNVSSMFSYCFKLSEINLGNKFVSNNITDMNRMFQNCYALTKVYFGEFGVSPEVIAQNVTGSEFFYNIQNSCTVYVKNEKVQNWVNQIKNNSNVTVVISED